MWKMWRHLQEQAARRADSFTKIYTRIIGAQREEGESHAQRRLLMWYRRKVEGRPDSPNMTEMAKRLPHSLPKDLVVSYYQFNSMLHWTG